jgi:hypothetical protein
VPTSISVEELGILKRKFRDFVRDEIDSLRSETDPDVLNSVADDITSIAKVLEMDLESAVEPITSRAGELEQEKEREKAQLEPRDASFDYDEWKRHLITQSREHTMFASLLDELTQAEEDQQGQSQLDG